MNLGACPHCSYNDGVYQAVRITGSAEQVWNDVGERRGIQRRRERVTPHSDVVRCCICDHIRRDWQAIDGELVRQGEKC